MTKPSAATKKTNTTVKLVHNGSMPTPEGPIPLAEFKKASQVSGSTERVAAASKSNKQPSQPQSWYVGPADFKPEDFPALSESRPVSGGQASKKGGGPAKKRQQPKPTKQAYAPKQPSKLKYEVQEEEEEEQEPLVSGLSPPSKPDGPLGSLTRPWSPPKDPLPSWPAIKPQQQQTSAPRDTLASWPALVPENLKGLKTKKDGGEA